MDIFLQPANWIALLTLTFLEIVLGIDNIIFISIITNRLDPKFQQKARFTGLSLALIFRIILLFGITYIIKFTRPVFSVGEYNMSIRDIILILGGLFLLIKSITEIHQKMEGGEHDKKLKTSGFATVIFQIVILDLVFSFDSILTAIGLTEQVILMVIAVIVSIVIMMIFSGAISRFINKHPTLQILALSFLILIGFTLIVDALHYHIPKGYIYFSVFFSLLVEVINMRVRKKSSPVELRKKMMN